VPLHLAITSMFVVIFTFVTAFTPCTLLLHSHMLPLHLRTCWLCNFAPFCYLSNCYYFCTLNLVVAFTHIVGFARVTLTPSHLFTTFVHCALPFHFQIPIPPPLSLPPPPPFCSFVPLLLLSHLATFCLCVSRYSLPNLLCRWGNLKA
jgi:hypothetical protein